MEVKVFINKIKNSMSFGHDRLDARTFKIAQNVLTAPITHIVNISITTSKFANKWRIGKMVPLLKGKSADQLNPKSSLTSKIVERVIQAQLVEHFELNRMWNSNQHGYHKNRSTTTALLQIADQLFEAADAKDIADILTVNESAAFDSLEIPLLLEKL